MNPNQPDKKRGTNFPVIVDKLPVMPDEHDDLQKLFDEQNELMRTFVAVLGDVVDGLNDNTEKIKLETIKLREIVEKGNNA